VSLKNPITEQQIPQLIARDAEFAAADAAHVLAPDPHSQYEFRAGLSSKVLAGARSFAANTWSSLGTFPGFSLGVQGLPSVIVVAIGVCFDTSFPWQQTSCSAQLSPVWWQPATVADPGVRCFMEIHNESGSYLNIRAGKLSGELRDIQINPENLISIPSSGRMNIILKRLV
jgi:hypothetical protein